MIKKISFIIFLILLIIPTVYAAEYGSGTYGAGKYGIGEEPVSPPSEGGPSEGGKAAITPGGSKAAITPEPEIKVEPSEIIVIVFVILGIAFLIVIYETFASQKRRAKEKIQDGF